MKAFSTVLVLCFCLTSATWSQTTTFPPIQAPLSQVKQFLALTDDQVNAIVQNNEAYNTFRFQQQQQIEEVQSQVAVETARNPIQPLALGTLYAQIETACRALREKATSSQQQNISTLTDAQKLKLNALNEALKLMPTITEAQFANLLGSTGSPPFAFISNSSTFGTDPGVFSRVSGCDVTANVAVQLPPPSFDGVSRTAIRINGNPTR